MVMAEEPKVESAGEREHGWEREVLTRLAYAGLVEQRRARRWSIFFRFVGLGIFALIVLRVLSLGIGHIAEAEGPHTAVVRLEGVIAPGTQADAAVVGRGLRAAFKAKGTEGVVLYINSPGGSPVQADEINREMLRLRKAYPKIPLYAVCSDVCASGGYYAAVGARDIYVNPASIVGSIGVRMDGFGFVDAMKKLGVTRRLMTAGEHKAGLDPFEPVKPEEKAHLQKLLDQVHTQFIDAVKRGRGKRLANDPTLFSGYFWTGEEALRLGLADGFGSVRYVARSVIKAPRVVDYTPRRDLFERFSQGLGTSVANALLTLQEKLSFGLQ
jgi:protease IV